MMQEELLERIFWGVDGYRFGYFDLGQTVEHVVTVITDNPEAVNQ